MDGEWEEEEQVVVAELSGMIDSDALRACESCFKVVGPDSEQPVLQLGRYVFAGEYEDAAGTCVIFQEEPQTGGNPALRYKCHTAKKLTLQRSFLSERKEGEPGHHGVEVLSLNEGQVCGRSTAVCHYVLDPKEHERMMREAEDESDPEGAVKEQRPAEEHSMLEVSEAAEDQS